MLTARRAEVSGSVVLLSGILRYFMQLKQSFNNPLTIMPLGFFEMMCVAKPKVWIWAAIMLGSGTTLVTGQDAATGGALLRLESDLGVEAPAAVSRQSRITIGDDSQDSIGRRQPRPDPFAAQGLRNGAFLLFPTLEIGTIVSSNVGRQSGNVDAGVGLRLKPEFRVESDWSRHRLTNTVSLTADTYAGKSEYNDISGSLSGDLRLDIRRTTTADFTWSYDGTRYAAGSSELSSNTDSGRFDQDLAASAALTHDFGGLEGRWRIGIGRNVFGDESLTAGGTQDNADRNYTELSLSARGTLRTGGVFDPFAEVSYSPRFHDKKIDRNGVQRNSQGLGGAIGFSFSDAPIWEGDVALTGDVRTYADDGLGTVFSPGFAASVTWRPTDLTQFEFNSGASLAETIDSGEAASKIWTVGGRVTHALRENIDLSTGLRGEFENSSDGTDVTVTATAGLDWTINPMMILRAGYEGTFFNGADADDNYTDHRLLTSIILRK
jgi:hypothetical protein